MLERIRLPGHAFPNHNNVHVRAYPMTSTYMFKAAKKKRAPVLSSCFWKYAYAKAFRHSEPDHARPVSTHVPYLPQVVGQQRVQDLRLQFQL